MQHTIPEAYLKYFATKKFVHVLELKHKHRRKIQKVGIGHSVFKKEKYYNFPNRSNEPILEKAFGKRESDQYESIITNLANGTNLGPDLKMQILEWILMLKTRSTMFRDQFENLFTWMEKTAYGLKSGKKAMDERIREFEQKGKQQAKAFQLSQFLDAKEYAELRQSYMMSFFVKRWEIISSKSINFLTSDNPGFSISFSEDILRLGLSPLSSRFNLDNSINAKHYFPLTNTLCLCASPILEIELDPTNEVDWEAIMKANITYSEGSINQIKTINRCTYFASNEIVVGNEFSDLLEYEESSVQNGISYYDTIHLI